MYLRTLLYALRQGVALDPRGKDSKHSEIANDPSVRASITSGPSEDEGELNVKVPDTLLDFYLSSKDSSSLTSKVLDMYAAYVDEGEVRVCVWCRKEGMVKYSRVIYITHRGWFSITHRGCNFTLFIKPIRCRTKPSDSYRDSRDADM